MPTTPSVRSVGNLQKGTAAITPGGPAGATANDILIMFVETANEALPTDPPTGWELAPSGERGAGTPGTEFSERLTVYWQRLTGSYTEESIGDSGDHQSAVIVCIQDAITTGNPFAQAANSGADSNQSTINFPAANTGGANNLVIMGAALNYDGNSTDEVGTISNSLLTNITEQVDEAHNRGSGGGLFVATAEHFRTQGNTGISSAALTHATRYKSWTATILPEPDHVPFRNVPYVEGITPVSGSTGTIHTIGTPNPINRTTANDVLVLSVYSPSGTMTSGLASWNYLGADGNYKYYWRRLTDQYNGENIFYNTSVARYSGYLQIRGATEKGFPFDNPNIDFSSGDNLFTYRPNTLVIAASSLSTANVANANNDIANTYITFWSGEKETPGAIEGPNTVYLNIRTDGNRINAKPVSVTF